MTPGFVCSAIAALELRPYRRKVRLAIEPTSCRHPVREAFAPGVRRFGLVWCDGENETCFGETVHVDATIRQSRFCGQQE